MDSSGVEAIDKVTKKYVEAGKSVKLRHLSVTAFRLLRRRTIQRIGLTTRLIKWRETFRGIIYSVLCGVTSSLAVVC